MPVRSRQVPNDGGDSLLEGGSRVCTLGRIEIADAAWIRDITPATADRERRRATPSSIR